jgi:hypothetical protein
MPRTPAMPRRFTELLSASRRSAPATSTIRAPPESFLLRLRGPGPDPSAGRAAASDAASPEVRNARRSARSHHSARPTMWFSSRCTAAPSKPDVREDEPASMKGMITP